MQNDTLAPIENNLDAAGPVGSELDLLAEINRLRTERNAFVLAHYYQEPIIQDLANVVGDSLQLAQAAQKANADVVLFCGVHFMAETAKILNPNATVVLPDTDAGCSLADRCHAELFREWLKDYPDHVVVSYINCSAGVKALSDIICTSSNVVRVINSIPLDKKIVFAPDRHLGRWVAHKTGREMALYPGFCVIHKQFSASAVSQAKAAHPHAKFLAHPECDISVSSMADFVGSTASMLNYVAKDSGKSFIIGTEAGILHQMKKARPDAEFVPIPVDSGGNAPLCPYMRLNTLEKMYLALRDLRPQVALDTELRQKALAPLERMLSLG
ncbi:MAG: quinolinate synthase NadA [Holophagales bacterium]|jgi:quinolinate synthase|nr:quinolinate synthase NadA [Holophagales bacterium]